MIFDVEVPLQRSELHCSPQLVGGYRRIYDWRRLDWGYILEVPLVGSTSRERLASVVPEIKKKRFI